MDILTNEVWEIVNAMNQIILTETLSIHETVKGKSNKMPGKRKPFFEMQTGEEKSVDRNKWVKKDRVIDRENDIYFEKVEDPDTGEVIHECSEPLSMHFGHGSAKFI